MPRRIVNQPLGPMSFDIGQTVSEVMQKLPANATIDDIEMAVLEEGQKFRENLFKELAKKQLKSQKKSAQNAQKGS